MNKRTKWSYVIGATGRDMAYALVSLYLMSYVQYTMKLTTLQYAVISACVVGCMVWDAVNDLLMGVIIENTHLKGGKFRPWILIGVLTNAVIIFSLFSLRPTGWAFVAFYVVFYLLWGMTYTMNDISYWGMLPSLTSDAGERNNLVTLMSIFICAGQFAVAGIVPIVIAGNAIQAYRIVALVVALCFIGFQLLTFFGVTESKRVENKETVSMKTMFSLFKRNDQLVHIGIASLLFNIASNFLTIFGLNFFYVEFGYSKSGDLVFLFTVMFGLGSLFSKSLYSTLSKHFTRAQLLKIAIICLWIGYGLMLSFGYILPKNVILLNAIGFMIFFFQGLFDVMIIVMINNTIEYDEYKYGERHEPVISAVRSFSVKLAGGINNGLSTLVFIVSGIYAMAQKISAFENQVEEKVLTSEEALKNADVVISQVTTAQSLTLRLGMVMIPVIALTTAYFIIKKKYKIDEVEYNRLVEGIKANKQ